MRLHDLGFPHTTSTNAYTWCAYTMKAMKFATMMHRRGHEVFLYDGLTTDAECTELINCSGIGSDTSLASVVEPDWTTDYFKNMNDQVIRELGPRLQPRDFVCVLGGVCQQPIAQAFPGFMFVEYGVGYQGTFSKYCVYESYAWMHACYSWKSGGPMDANGQSFDAVIPNYFDVEQFPKGSGDGDYLLFVGRLIARKGLEIAIETADACGLPLVVAGHGDFSQLPEWVDYRGVVGPRERAELMGGARALMCPTLYVGPFEGVNVEAQCCGTPVITTDWGAFAETVEQGVTGYRCRVMSEFIDAVGDVESLDRDYIRERAIRLYSTENVALQYERYFERLLTLWEDGFYQGYVGAKYPIS